MLETLGHSSYVVLCEHRRIFYHLQYDAVSSEQSHDVVCVCVCLCACVYVCVCVRAYHLGRDAVSGEQPHVAVVGAVNLERQHRVIPEVLCKKESPNQRLQGATKQSGSCTNPQELGTETRRTTQHKRTELTRSCDNSLG